MTDRIFYLAAGAFTIGILADSFFRIGFSFFILLCLFSISIYSYGRFFRPGNPVLILTALFIFSAALGLLRYEIKESGTDNRLDDQLGQKVSIQGSVVAEPAEKDSSVQLILSTASGKILVQTGLFPSFHYGDQVLAEGRLAKPDNFETDYGRTFDYVGYLAKDDIFYKLDFATVRPLSAGGGSWLIRHLLSVKESFQAKINSLIKEPESSLLGGLLLGSKNSLGQDWQEDFRRAGVSHIVALSGYNITIVAVMIMSGLSFLPYAWALGFGALGIILFALMTGGSATVLRASIMALLVLLSRGTGRKYDVRRALVLAGVMMLLENPKILVFDLSFQLSFLATIALIFVSPIMERRALFITKRWHLREIIVSSLATQVIVLPFLLYKVGLISTYSLFSNVLILPVIPLVMLLGFLTGVLGFLSAVLAFPLAVLSSFFLSYILAVIHFFANLPFASFIIR